MTCAVPSGRFSRVVDAARDGRWLLPRRLAVYPALMLAGWMAMVAVGLLTRNGVLDPNGKVIGTDFLTFWSASAMALAGRAAEVYDWSAHAVFERLVVGADHPGFYGWYYPPLFLVLVLPLALLPYLTSLVAALAATFPGYWLTVRRILPGREAILPALAFPGLWINLVHGQNGFLTVGLLGGGLLLLERRPWLAGILIGLLAYKPHFGLLLPLALMAGGHWRAIGGAVCSLAASVVLSVALFGGETWQAFLASLEQTRTVVIEQGGVAFEKSMSTFAAVRLLGGDVLLAYAAQGVVIVLAAVAVAALWRRPDTPFPVKAAGLVVATPLSVPFMLDYDLVMLALPIAWLVVEGRRTGFRPWEKTLLAVAWVLPLVARGIASALPLSLAPPVLAALLATILVRAWAPQGQALAMPGGRHGA